MVRLTEQAEGLADTLHGDRRLILHAVYFEAKTVAQGRKVPAALACANPILKDVAEVLTILRIPWQFEDKAYSRNPTVERGRLRVVLRNDEDMPSNPDVPDRKSLYKAVSKLLQEHPERKKRAAAFASRTAAPAPAAVFGLPALPSPAAAGAGAAGGSSKKNNKKGKK